VGIEELRKCCGGAGYLLASGIAAIEADYKWRATAEGDTVVMLLQTARYLVKSAGDARNGRPLSGLCACFADFSKPGYNPITDSKPHAATKPDDFLSLGDYTKSCSLLLSLSLSLSFSLFLLLSFPSLFASN
jgi:hypothetical protein